MLTKVVTKSALENLYRVYLKATEELRATGRAGAAERLFEDFGHELTAWDSWYDDGARADERPDYAPTMGDLNSYLKAYGLKGIGGRNPRVVKL